MNVIWALLLWYFRPATAQNSDCDYYQKLDRTTRVTIESPRYPANYTGALQCRWIVDCPDGYNCRMDCAEIALPQSASCMRDKLLVSKSGDSTLTGAATYCGRGSLSVVSTRQRLAIGLITPSDTIGGRFICEVSAQPVTLDVSCTCGYRRQNRIVGGQETGINEYPMMVGIVLVALVQIKCGGVIISNYHVMSGAHCVNEMRPTDIVVIAGEHNVTTYDSPATKAYEVAKIEKHPLYSDTNYDYDIAIITVKNPITFSDRVGPVCLPFKFANRDFAGDNVTVLGWGTLFFGGPDSETLQKVDVSVITEMRCRFNVSTVTSRQLCTYTAGKDSCQDDSGGPLLYTDPKTALLYSVGIVSYGRSCASRQPSVNTRVTAFLDWIVATTRVSFCMK